MLEALFFQCYYAFLRGDLGKTRLFYEVIKEECASTKESLPLTRFQLLNLKQVKIALEGESITAKVWATEESQPSANKQKKFYNQDDLVEKIHREAFLNLKNFLKAKSDFHLYNLEHPCDPYGAVDMLYMDELTAYPVEVKRDRGKHDIIAQIAKYELACKLKLHYKMYQLVQPVTICESYDPLTLAELKRNGVKALRYTMGKQLQLRYAS